MLKKKKKKKAFALAEAKPTFHSILKNEKSKENKYINCITKKRK